MKTVKVLNDGQEVENCLYIVATPIGNLKDMTTRAVEVLRSVDYIAAEDTRHSVKLMRAYDIDTRLQAYHDHSGDEEVARIIAALEQGKSVALISDAGTPLISDPGYKLVKQVRAAGHKVVPIPGACALIAAISAAGVPSDKFTFEGFLPAKSKGRREQLAALVREERTLVFYESPHRILDSLQDMCEVFGGERSATIARELTKTFETFLSKKLEDLIAAVAEDPNQQKGEFVILIEGYTRSDEAEAVSSLGQKAMRILSKELGRKKAAAIAAELSGDSKNMLYKWSLQH